MDPGVFLPDTLVSRHESQAILPEAQDIQILIKGFRIHSRAFLPEPRVFCGIFGKTLSK